MRFKTLVSMVLLTIMLLMSVTSVIFLGNITLGDGTEYWDESTYNQTSSQSASESAASSPRGLQGDSSSVNSATRSSGTEKANPNMFNFDSYAKDLSSHKTEEWRNFAYIDDDSAELVIGLNNAQPGYTKVADLIFESGGKLVNTVSTRDETVAVVADVPLDVVSYLAVQLQASNLVRYVEPNMKFEAQFFPDDPGWAMQWGPKKIEADYAWDTTTGDPSVLVAIIDTGIDYDHPDLAANYVKLGYDWVNNDPYPMDDHGHGTHCAGIVAAELNNGIGIAGVAQVSIMAEKGLDAGGWGTEDDLANALIHAVNRGADILSNSWGGYGESALIYDAVRYAYDSGVLIVAAAGNGATSTKMYPAAYDEVVAVTATDQDDNPAVFTNFGDWVEVAAPGVSIYSTVWDNSYAYMSGTSMSTPHVSGTAALIWSQFPSMSRDWVWAQLEFTADDLGDPGFDKYYGYGRINARKAVEQGPPDHDLLILDWERPRFVQPWDLVIFNATVLNFGTAEESDIIVQLLVDSSVVDSAPIDSLASGASATVSTLWNPTAEGMYNVTCYVLPVPGETATENNQVSETVTVRYLPKLLVVDAPLHEDTDALDRLGYMYTLVTPTEFATVDLYEFDCLFIGWQPGNDLVDALLARSSDIASWVAAGNGIVALAEFYEANRWAWLPMLVSGSSSFPADAVHILNSVHPVMSGLTDAELSRWGNSYHGYFISYDSAWEALAEGVEATQPITLATIYGAGRIVITNQDPDFHLCYGNQEGAEKLLRNMIEWAASSIQYEHELSVSLEAPAYLKPGDPSLLRATVYNRGLSNETDVELFLLINGTLVDSATVPKLVNGTSYAIDYEWTPAVEARYNVTAYAPPVVGENQTLNNVATKFVVVIFPLINPIEGQWANYTVNYCDDTGRIIGAEYWTLTYDHFVKPYKIYITLMVRDRYGNPSTSWMIVNTMTRFVESGVWFGMWYPGWIETDINIGSSVNLLSDVAIVKGSKVVPVGIYPIDCWELSFGMYGSQYTFWYDKVSGLWIGMDYEGYPYRAELRLTETNVPIGTTYEHELAATVEAPARLEPNDSSLLNATAYNIGLNTETDVKLSLLMDGIEVESLIIPAFLNGTSHTISYLWTPTIEAAYNVTAYVQPVAGEAFAVNNAATKSVRVRSVKGYVLFDQTHGTDSIFMYTIWVNNMTDRGYIVDTLTVSPLTPSALEGYDVFVIPQAHYSYNLDEISAIRNFVLDGGGLLVIGDDSTYIYSDLTRFAGITWDWGGYWGYTSDITPHEVTDGVKTAYFDSPCKVYVSLPAQGLIRDSYRNILLAVSEAGAGAVICIADENTIMDWDIGYADNLRLANNMIDWLKSRHPIASFTYSPLDPYVGETVGFDGSASYDPDGVIVGYLWNFGDGDTASGVTATHVYAAGGAYTAALTVVDNEGFDFTATANVTVARTMLEVSVEVGPIHFRGEVAEFYVLVSSLGKPVDAELSAVLYYGGTVYEDLSAKVTQVGTGLYRIPYTVSTDALPGTYALVVEASYLSLRGVALKSFLLSSTLTGSNALLVNIDGTVGTLKTDAGLIKVQLDAINAKLVSIEGRTATLDSAVGVIQTDVDTIHANVCAIDGTVVTIISCLGSVQQDIALINGEISAIDGTLATIQTDLGVAHVDVSRINAKLVALNNTVATVQTALGMVTTDIGNLRLKVTSIDGTVATIQTTLGTIKGTVTSIQGDVATIKTDVGTVKASLPPGWTEPQQQDTTPIYIVLILVLIISIGTIILIFFRRKKS